MLNRFLETLYELDNLSRKIPLLEGFLLRVAHKGGSGGGGGSSGKVNWPGYLIRTQARMIYTGVGSGRDINGTFTGGEVAQGPSIETAIANAWGNSPYTSLAAYDPADRLDEMDNRYSAYDAVVSALSPQADWDTFIAAVLATVESTVLPDAEARDYIDVFDVLLDAMSAGSDWGTFATTSKTAVDSDVLPIAEGKTIAVNLHTDVDALDPSADWQSDVDDVLAKATADVLSPETIEAVVEEFDSRQTGALNRAVNRFVGGMADVNAVCGSQFVLGIAWLNQQHLLEVSRVNAELTMQFAKDKVAFVQNGIGQISQARIHKLDKKQAATAIQVQNAQARGQLITQGASEIEVANRFAVQSKAQSTAYHIQLGITKAQAILQSAQGVAQMLAQKIDAERTSVAMRVEIDRISLIAQKEQIDSDMDLATKHHLWDLEIFQHGANLLAAIQGGTGTPGTGPGPVRAGSASVIGGTLSGAAAGAMMGSAVPGVGTAIGAAVGGIAGYLSSSEG